MKTYTITVNGTAYDVTGEEGTGSGYHCFTDLCTDNG